jgi:hypothetical protein
MNISFLGHGAELNQSISKFALRPADRGSRKNDGDSFASEVICQL